MDNYDSFEQIEKIDTSRPMRKSMSDIVSAIIELQVKMNEVIDAVNIIMMPDEPLDDDDEDDPTPISVSNVTLGNKKGAKS